MIGIGCITVYVILSLVILIPLLFGRIITGAFLTLGFTQGQALILLIFALVGSFINIPIKKWPEVHIPPYQNPHPHASILPHALHRFVVPQNRFLAINLGGAIIPGTVSLWEIYRLVTEFNTKYPHGIYIFFIVLIINTLICYKIAKPVPGKGIALPALIPPLTVSVLSLLLLPDLAPLIAFPAGVLGVLIGADIMHLKDIRYSNALMGSIGGAGTLDGIFLCGILSVFLTG